MELRKIAFWLTRDVYKHSEAGRWFVRFAKPAAEEGVEILELVLEEDQAEKLAAHILGSKTSYKKARSSAANGKLGGRPKKNPSDRI
jgi:hypothetical protein